MYTLVSIIQEYLEENSGSYVSPHAVEFTLLHGSISIDYSIVEQHGEKYMELFLVYTSRNIQKFIRDFSISRKSDLALINVDQLWALFDKGEVEIQCCMGEEIDAPFMRYKYYNNQLIAMDHSNQGAYIVEKPLKIPSDFISYTLSYFENINS